MDSQSNLFVADEARHDIRMVTPVGTNWVITTIAGSGLSGSADGIGTNAQFGNMCAITASTDGNLYALSGDQGTIRKITLVGTNWVVSTISGTNGIGWMGTNGIGFFASPQAITSDSTGNLYVVDTTGCAIYRVTPVGTNWVVSLVAGTPWQYGYSDGTNNNAIFYDPEGIAVDTHSNLYVADWYNCVIRKITPAGTNWVVNTIAGTRWQYGEALGEADGIGTNALFTFPVGITVDPQGNLFVTDERNCIRKLTLVGTNWVVSTVAGIAGLSGNTDGTGTNALFYNPYGIVADSTGRLFVGDVNNHVIRMGWNPSKLTLTEITANNLVVSWPATGCTLQYTENFSAGWTDYNSGATSTSNGINFLTFPPVKSPMFFRLAYP